MSTVANDEAVIPARRLSAKSHLARAAKSPLASDAERYHEVASIAESLVRIEQHLELTAKILVDLGGRWLDEHPRAER